MPAPRVRAVLGLTRALGRRPMVIIAAIGLAAGLITRSNLVYLVTLLAGGMPLVWQTVRGMLRGRFAADIVATLAIVTALILGQYFAGVVIVLLQSGGESLEAYAMQRASSSLEALMARAPKVAHRLRNGDIDDVAVDTVVVGDRLLVRPGDLVPVDAEVIDGTSAVDQSALTGEPLPLRAVVGTHLLSGSVNLDGALRVRALRPSAQSQYQQIVVLVERARQEKPPIQRIADRFAVWFTPLTLLMCAIAYLATGSATNVLAVLVVATPCPLILATPVAVIAGISRAADPGVIVKHGRAIEQLGQARAVVFDKTGTLTLGQPSVSHVEGDVLRVAAAVEQLSSHHLAHAVVDAGRERYGALPKVTEFRESPGRGVSGCVEGRDSDGPGQLAPGRQGCRGARSCARPWQRDDGGRCDQRGPLARRGHGGRRDGRARHGGVGRSGRRGAAGGRHRPARRCDGDQSPHAAHHPAEHRRRARRELRADGGRDRGVHYAGRRRRHAGSARRGRDPQRVESALSHARSAAGGG